MGGFTVTRNNNDGGTSIAIIPDGITIEAKGYLVIYQGGTVSSPVEGAIDCMPFGISMEKFMSAILKDKEGRIVDNSFDIGNPQTVKVSDVISWARETDGSAIIIDQEPTAGKSNTSQPEMSGLHIFINEVNAMGKWIELYNDEDTDIDVSEYLVIRNNSDGTVGIAIIPAEKIITAKGFLVLYQGNAVSSPVVGAINCLPYDISADKFMSTVLRDAQMRLVDSTFNIGNPQTVTALEEQSWARKPDGDVSIEAIEPTPGTMNYITSNPIIRREDNVKVFVYAGILYLPENVSHIQLYAISSKLLLSRNVRETSIDVNMLPKGIYIVKLTVSGTIFAKIIVIE